LLRNANFIFRLTVLQKKFHQFLSGTSSLWTKICIIY
jgi:hypothetical protein